MSEKRRIRRESERSKVALKKLTFHQLDWLEYVTIALAIWFFLYPHPYKVLFAILVSIPILGLLLNGINGKPSIASLGKFEKDKHGNDEYDVADFIDVAAWVILLRILIDFEFESFYSILIIGSVAFAIVIAILFLTHSTIQRSQKSRTWIYLSIVGSIMIYSYAGAYGINCIFDNSVATVYQTPVVDKHIYRGKHTTYYLTIAPWGHHYDKEDIKVSSEQYENTNPGQLVKIDVKEGLLGIPWYHIEE